MAERRFVVVGCGSIGRRHARNLLALGQTDIVLVEPDESRRAAAERELGLPSVPDLAAGLALRPEAVLVTNPTVDHGPTSLAAARAGCHLFIEKPLDASLDKCSELAALVRERGLVALVGCNMRFHPGPSAVHAALAGGRLGLPLAARLEVGSYLPDWRPSTDYRSSYSARRALGGGCILDAIHEIDLALWLFGYPDRVYASAIDGAVLAIETEAIAEILLRYRAGPLVSIHLDYVQRWRQRRCEVIGTSGTVAWEARATTVSLFRADTAAVQSSSYGADYDTNAMYLAELRHFLNCLDGVEEPVLDVVAATRVLEVALAARAAAESGQPVDLPLRVHA